MTFSSLLAMPPPTPIPLGAFRISFAFFLCHSAAQPLGPSHHLEDVHTALLTPCDLASAHLSSSLATLTRSLHAPRPFLPLCLCSFFAQGLDKPSLSSLATYWSSLEIRPHSALPPSQSLLPSLGSPRWHSPTLLTS